MPDVLTLSRLLIPGIIALAFLEGWFVSRRSRGALPYIPATAFSLLFLFLLTRLFLWYLPRLISDAGWRFIPDFWIDNFLYAGFVLLSSLALKGGLDALLVRLTVKEPPRMCFAGLFALAFLLFNLPILVLFACAGLQNVTWPRTYDVSRAFPDGIDFVVDSPDGTPVSVSRKNAVGQVVRLSEHRYPEGLTPSRVAFLQKQNSTDGWLLLNFDSEEKTTPSGRRVTSNPERGGLTIESPDAPPRHVTYQTILHRWRPARFALLPNSERVLFSVGNANYVYDTEQNELIDLAFARGTVRTATIP